MKKRHSFSQLKKYDVNQKVIEALADAQSRVILFSIIKQGKTVMELSEEHRIPLSSVYKKISDLEDIALVKVDKWMISDNGKKFKIYRIRISKADVSIKKPEPTIILTANDQN